jgi:anti-sigma B factor antagonist
VIVVVRGDLDVVTGPQFDEYLTVARREHNRIVLDLAGVDFMDTSALAAIVGHWKGLLASGGTLSLAGARYRYTKSLWITGLADRLPLYDSVDEAVAAGQAAASPEQDASVERDAADSGQSRPRPKQSSA